MLRLARTPLVLILLTACPRGEAPPEQPGAAGRFELRDSASGRLMAARALATYCADDSSIAVISLARAGSGGVAARVRWPAEAGATDSLRLGRRLDSIGTATLAFRPLGDTVRYALVADSGILSLRGDSTVSGSGRAWSTTVTSTDTTVDTSVVRLEARLEGIPVVMRCPGNPR